MATQGKLATKIIILISFIFSNYAFAGDGPEFDQGFGESHFKWGVEVPVTDKNSDFRLRLGTRLQAIMEDQASTDNSGETDHNQDFYVRRARLQVEAKFRKNLSFYMDIRADKVDAGNSGKNAFEIGDAFLQVKNVFNNKNLKLRLFRAKYDISKTQTISSSRLLTPLRVSISDYAADYISHGRRGTNAQLLGNWDNRIKAQIAIGDSIHEKKFKDSLNNGGADLNSQNFAMGARLRVSPFKGWEEGKLKETYFGQGKHFTLGAGHYRVDNIKFEASGRTFEVDRELNNFDASFHWGPVSLSAEYFMFKGVIDDFSSALFVEGESDGWFAQAEYVFTGYHFLAPFVRVQSWDRFKERSDFTEKSVLAGINYYIKGNKLKAGIYYGQTEYGNQLAAAAGLNPETSKIGVHLMMHY